MMHLQENTQLKNGKYRIVRKLGQGGYGITYLATTFEEVKGGMGTFPVSVPVAIKEFFVKTYSVRDALSSDVLVPTAEGKEQVPLLMKDFVREAKSMAKMDHPNIVRVIDIFEEHQTVYYVMQYLEGCSLEDKVSRGGPLDVNDARQYIFQVASAVAYLHDRNVCHYDVKPSNIMLLDDGRAVLVDFGISRHYDNQGNATTVRGVGYSSGFSSPEQILGDVQRFSPASDIYSLAATLFFTLTGKIPSDEVSERNLGKCPPDVPKDIWEAVVRGMEADSSKRPNTVREWLALTEDITKTRPEGSDAPRPVQPIDEENPEPTPSSKPDKKPVGAVANNKIRSSFLSKKVIKTALTVLAICVVGSIAAYLIFSHGAEKTDSDKKSEVKDLKWSTKNRYGNTYVFTGTAIDSIPNGRGKAKYSDGSTYEGLFRDGLREDEHATYIDSDGNKFTGTFSNDTICNGRITAPDGRYYEGSFSGDAPFDGFWYDTDGTMMFTVKRGELIPVD